MLLLNKNFITCLIGAVVIGFKGEGNFIYYQDGEIECLSNLTKPKLIVMEQAFSKLRGKEHQSFVYDGMMVPINIIRKMAFTHCNLSWL